MADPPEMSNPYPIAPKRPIVEVIHGTAVPDPFRLLEDADDPDTTRWVAAQNALTRAFLDGPARDSLAAELKALFNYPRLSVPLRRGSRYFFTYNTGLQKQSVLCAQRGCDGTREVLLDPNALSSDGTVALTAFAPSEDGRLVAYALSRGGSDRQEIYARDVETGREFEDVVRWARFTAIAWLKDGSGYYYTRFPEPGTVPPEDENYYGTICLHRLGSDPREDAVVFSRPDDREIVPSVAISSDGRWLVVAGFKGSSEKCEVFVGRPGSPDRLVPLFTGFTASWVFIDAVEDRLYFQTDQAAPHGRVVAVEMGKAPASPMEVIGETEDKLNLAIIAGDRLVLAYLHHASDRLRLVPLNGATPSSIELPIGSLFGLTGRPDEDEFLYGFMSFTTPPTVFRVTGGDNPREYGDSPALGTPHAYRTRQVWYPSKDGTPVSMFIVHREGLALDGNRPVLLYGYGGFSVNMTPGYDPGVLNWLHHGGVYALANLRGGGEYGEAWHQAGMFEKKQNVFDDFIAAAEWLVANNYTNPARLAIEGGSNGGLLVAAVMVQRPDLFGAVVCRVPVADMLRYHLFTVGRFWTSEYGSADDPAQFPYLLAYSPYHNVRDRVAYPATLVMTADTDDRVAPGMAKKFAARLQEATSGPAPILLRVETRAGHGAGKPVSKLIEEDADIQAFLNRVMGR